MQATQLQAPKFFAKSSQELTYPTDKYLVYPDGTKKIYQNGQIRDVGINETVDHGELILAFPHVKYFYLNQ